MPLFHFDVIRDGSTEPDPNGVELAGVAEARREALALLPELMKEPKLRGCRELGVSVRDGEPYPLFTARASITLKDRD